VTRIAIITPEYPEMRRPAYGGIAAQYAVMAPALAATGEEVHVFVPGNSNAALIEREGVFVHGVAAPRRTGPLFPVVRALATRRALGALPKFDLI
jgi:hypothetical protein